MASSRKTDTRSIPKHTCAGKVVGLLLVSGLVGCWEEPQHKKAVGTQTGTQSLLASPFISQRLHEMPDPPKDKVVEQIQEESQEWQLEPAQDQPEVAFSKSEEVFMPYEVEMAQRKREQALQGRKTVSLTKKPEKKTSFPVDPDYKTHLPSIGEDVSTFPVRSDRVLTADRYIPIVLENSINSQMGGRFIGIVDEHVFANRGRKIILPKGSRLICAYESLSGEGHSRLIATCTRILRPDGVNVVLTDSYVADHMGRKGIPGSLNHRLWDKYGAAFVLAGLSSLAAAGTRNNLPSVVQQSTGMLGLQTAQMTAQTLKETINIAPVMDVASGSRLLIIPMNDIWMRGVDQAH